MSHRSKPSLFQKTRTDAKAAEAKDTISAAKLFDAPMQNHGKDRGWCALLSPKRNS